MDVQGTLNKGIQAHTGKDFALAEQCYKQVLKIVPDHPDAIHFLGVLAQNTGHFDVARAYIQKAIELLPTNQIENELIKLKMGKNNE